MQQHIWLDEQGKAWVDDTNTKVIEIVKDVLAYGWSLRKFISSTRIYRWRKFMPLFRTTMTIKLHSMP